LRWPYDATAFCERCLHCLKAHQKPTVLPQQMHQKPPLSGQEGEHENPTEESQQLGHRKRSEPGDSAGSGTAFVARPQDEPCNGGKSTVAGECPPASRGGVQLAEAVAIGLASAGQVDGDAGHKEEQQG
jgi:hypothetical protein